MAEKQRKKKCPPEGAADWMLTYGDMVTLLLTFFVMLFTISEVDEHRLRLIMAAFSGLGILEGGNTLEPGTLAEMGHTIMALPSQDRGRALDNARKEAISRFQPEIKTKKVRVTVDERGLVISLAADSFFREASAEVDIEAARELLQRIVRLLKTLSDSNFAVEGHTDATPTDPDSDYSSNWELSSARANNVLHYLVDLGADESKFQTRGYASTMPIASNDTRDGRAYNRRIDIVILSEGHL